MASVAQCVQLDAGWIKIKVTESNSGKGLGVTVYSCCWKCTHLKSEVDWVQNVNIKELLKTLLHVRCLSHTSTKAHFKASQPLHVSLSSNLANLDIFSCDTVSPPWSTTLSWWWGINLRWPERFLKSVSREPTKSRPTLYEQSSYTFPVHRNWLIFGLTADSASQPQGCGLGQDVSVSRWSWNVLTSCLRQNPQCLGLGATCLGLDPVGLISSLGPLRLIETFCAGTRRAYCSCS